MAARSSIARAGTIAAGAAVVLLFLSAVRAQIPDNPLRVGNRSPVTASISDLHDSAPTPAEFWDEAGPGQVHPAIAIEDSVLESRERANESWPAGSPSRDSDVNPDGRNAPHDSWVQPWFTHTDPNDPYRHTGKGRPLVGTSWLNRPWYVGAFIGGLLADDLIADRVLTNNSFFVGGRLGWDFDHYWGLEGRYAFSRPQISRADGDPLGEAVREYYADLSLAYYPWGDSQWRPFWSIGLGFQTFRFHDDLGERVHQSLLSVPIGGGLKFFYSPHCTLRLEAYDNIAWGDGQLETMHNFTLAVGAEFRFGGRPTSYFPWHTTTVLW